MMSIDERRQTNADAHVTTLLSQASRQFGRLAHDEIQAARTELAGHRRDLGLGGGLIGVAGVLAFIAVQALAAAVIAAIAVALPVWAAALVVRAAAGLAGAVAALVAKKRVRQVVPAVGHTMDSVKADLAAIKDGE